MSPQFNCGDYVVLLTAFYIGHSRKNNGRFIHPGQTLVFDHPQYGRMIKEILSVSTVQRTFTATGLNHESVSPQQMGAIPFETVIGRVIWSIRKPLSAKKNID